ncbi:MAG: hypothetical protein SFT92_09895 [Rickettsiales bacterium]|nr:hypothetical protein [Rickettsiales bacterium]
MVLGIIDAMTSKKPSTTSANQAKKKESLAKALRQNLLRRKQAPKPAASSSKH